MKKSKLGIFLIVLVFIIGFGSLWASLPIRYICPMRMGSIYDCQFSLINPNDLNSSEDETPIQWVILETKTRVIAVGIVIVCYIIAGIVFFINRTDRLNQKNMAINILPNEEQRKKLNELISLAFIEIRLIAAEGRGKQASDLADAFHNISREMYGWGTFSWDIFRGMLQDYQEKYHGEFYFGITDYIRRLDEIQKYS